MSANKSLGYESLKCIVGYMDPGVRFSTVQQSPSFASIDRIVPYRINYLHIGPDAITINKTSYKLGIIQVYTNQETPEGINAINNQGGLLYDVDRYGINSKEEPNIENDKRKVRRLENNIETLKHLRSVKLADNQIQQVEELDKREELVKLRMGSYSLRLENADPPYTHYIQLKIGETAECLVYNKTLIEARDYFLRRIFGSSGRKVQVLMLEVGPSLNPEYPQFIEINDHIKPPLLPLEPGKLTVHKMRIRHHLQKVSEAIRPILSDQKLDSLEIGAYNDPSDPLIVGSKHLILVGQPTIDVFSKFSNKRIHMEQCITFARYLENLVNKLKLDGELSEKIYSIGLEKDDIAVILLGLFRRQSGLERPLELKNGLIISLNEKFDLHVNYERTSIEDNEICEQPWIVKMRIQRK